jgi:2-polyprenyl-3-methyl-5-hydroxy-6-metoxy-1,4-benzoquinol methylase
LTVHQETEGLLSPIIRDIRLKQVAQRIRRNETVLDLACGNLYLARHLAREHRYLGVDRTPAGPENSGYDFLLADLADADTPARLESLIQGKVDVITCAAFLEHITNPTEFLNRYRSLLRPGGRLIGTTPHPRGKTLHNSLAQLYLCSRSGAAEHEDFLSKDDLERIAVASGGKLTEYQQFLFGLNQIFVFEYP